MWSVTVYKLLEVKKFLYLPKYDLLSILEVVRHCLQINEGVGGVKKVFYLPKYVVFSAPEVVLHCLQINQCEKSPQLTKISRIQYFIGGSARSKNY